MLSPSSENALSAFSLVTALFFAAFFSAALCARGEAGGLFLSWFFLSYCLVTSFTSTFFSALFFAPADALRSSHTARHNTSGALRPRVTIIFDEHEASLETLNTCC